MAVDVDLAGKAGRAVLGSLARDFSRASIDEIIGVSGEALVAYAVHEMVVGDAE